MGASALTMSIPLHAARRQAEYLPHLLELALAELAVGRPADDFLARHYREHREFGGRDRRFRNDFMASLAAGCRSLSLEGRVLPACWMAWLHIGIGLSGRSGGFAPPLALTCRWRRAVRLKSYLQLAEPRSRLWRHGLRRVVLSGRRRAHRKPRSVSDPAGIMGAS